MKDIPNRQKKWVKAREDKFSLFKKMRVPKKRPLRPLNLRRKNKASMRAQ